MTLEEKAVRLIRKSLKYYGVSDDLGPAGSLSENLAADLIEAGWVR